MKTARRSAYSIDQRRRQAKWKLTTPELPLEARRPGEWKGRPYGFILPAEAAKWNLWEPIRDEVIGHFDAQDIAWHDEGAEAYGHRSEPGPSPHLLDSQVCALNFWWGLARSPVALAAVLRTAFPRLAYVTPPVDGGPLVEPEWMGLRNYLGEIGARRRGKYATSADFLVAFVDEEGRRHGVMIESKYTEDYSADEARRISKAGRDRLAIYRSEIERSDSPLRQPFAIPVSALFIEPFDQHMRQQLLARAMERDRELEFDSVTCLHVAPHANTAFHTTVTVEGLSGPSVADAWRSLLREPDRYRSVYYEELFAAAATRKDPALVPWTDYIRARYGW